MKIYVSIRLLLIVSIMLLSACSSNLSRDSYTNGASSTASTASSNTSTALMNKGKKIFSNNAELSYVAEAQKIYKIETDDILDISVFQADELTKKLKVNSKGNITFPLIGRFHVKGLSQEQAEKKLESMLGAKYLQKPQVTIIVTKNKKNEKITLEGWVKTAGIFPLEGDVTLLQSIALAHGLNDLADPTKVILFRKSTGKAYLLNLQDIRDGKARDPYVVADDRIVVAKSGSRSFIKDASTILGGVFAPLRGIAF